MSPIDRLNLINRMPVYSVFGERFRKYGRVVSGYDFSQVTEYMKKRTSIPQQGNIYVPSVSAMENTGLCREISASFYGGMEVQIGYCNGVNSTYNGFEYHKGSEINLAVTGMCLALGHKWDIVNGCYRCDQAEVFYVPEGVAVELYSTTLHLSPLRINDEGFKTVVILPKGTNTELSEEEKRLVNREDPETKLLLKRNKWLICHPENEPLVSQGAFPGLTGDNIELHY